MRKNLKKYIVAIPVILVLAYVVFTKLGDLGAKMKSPPRASARYLDRKYAEFRALHMSGVHYNLHLDITKADKYSGTVEIDFNLDEPVDLTLDFFDGTVEEVVINDEKIDSADYNKFFLTFSRKSFEAGANKMSVKFSHAYGKTGTGLYRFVDAEDQNVYLYSDFEPYDANAMFPCFDQPDLKGVFKSTVLAPKAWEVISTTRESGKTEKGENQEWVFPESARISTYVYSLHAGPYTSWASEADTGNHETPIPLRLFARQSLAKYVDPEEWFSTTRQGFQFFEGYFDVPYPFLKYDQLIVPDFNSGAMENVAAVTFNERYVNRSEKQRSEKRKLASVILHEMGHMWFGDLVTMKWWNDIWLNESFATYISYRAMVANTPYKEGWSDFFTKNKTEAYEQDQLVTTHPIEFEVANTDVVFANFDGITYGKGASVLKQLNFYIGDEKFRLGLQNYFKLFAYDNTTLGEFINHLTNVAAVDLGPWQGDWLQTPQVNTIEVQYKCEAGKIKEAVLHQTAVKDFPRLRRHKTVVGLYELVNRKLRLVGEPVEVSYGADITPIPEIEDRDCSHLALIYPNVGDYDYVKVLLDEKSTGNAKSYISTIDDELVRLGLWNTLWEMVVTQELSVGDYIDAFLKNSTNEPSDEVLMSVLGQLKIALQKYLPTTEEFKKQHDQITARVSAHVFKGIQSATAVDRQKIWFDFYVSTVEQASDLKVLASALDKKPSWLKFDLDQDRRWAILRTLNSEMYAEVEKRIEAEKVRDSSDRGLKSAMAAEVVRPDINVKKQYWDKIAQGPSDKMSLAQLRVLIENIFPDDQDHLQGEFSANFYESIRSLEKAPGEFLKYFSSLAPDLCATESVNKLKDFTEKNLDLPPTVVKRFRVNVQEGERCVGIREKMADVKAL